VGHTRCYFLKRQVADRQETKVEPMIPESLRQPREETFDLTDGEALLDVRGGEFDAGCWSPGGGCIPLERLQRQHWPVSRSQREHGAVEPRLAAIRQIVERRRVNPRSHSWISFNRCFGCLRPAAIV